MGEWPAIAVNPPARLLMGPGPSLVHPRVYRAMAAPLLGYADPLFFQILDEIKDLLRLVYNTRNDLTFAISGTGTAGMETVVCNSLEPGDHVVVAIHGFFGNRIAEMAMRHGAEVTRVEAEWGTALDPGAIKAALDQHPRTKALALVHAETSTGVLQPMEEIARIAKEHDTLLILDTVTSISGIPIKIDDWGVDFCYSGTQKCLSAPPGLSPITVSARGEAAIAARKKPVENWYLDLSLIRNYWSQGRVYHHTPPTTMIYALREALAIVAEEGLEARYERHARNARALQLALEVMGFELFVAPEIRLPSLNTVVVPQGIDEALVRRTLLNEHNIDIGGGQGPLAGKIWRIGLMGYGSSRQNIVALLAALHQTLSQQHYQTDIAAGLAAVDGVLRGQ